MKHLNISRRNRRAHVDNNNLRRDKLSHRINSDSLTISYIHPKQVLLIIPSSSSAYQPEGLDSQFCSRQSEERIVRPKNFKVFGSYTTVSNRCSRFTSCSVFISNISLQYHISKACSTRRRQFWIFTTITGIYESPYKNIENSKVCTGTILFQSYHSTFHYFRCRGSSQYDQIPNFRFSISYNKLSSNNFELRYTEITSPRYNFQSVYNKLLLSYHDRLS